jgi:ligand-binding sensor domain-containing protein
MGSYSNGLVSSVWLQRALIIVAISTALLSVPVYALNPDRQISQYAHTAWRLQDGFLGSYPSAIAQTTDGYIWVGTQSGIERFDGVRFVPWIPRGEKYSDLRLLSSYWERVTEASGSALLEQACGDGRINDSLNTCRSSFRK